MVYVVEDTSYHFRTQLTEFRNEETGETYSAAFYADAPVVPADTRAMHYPLDRLDRPVSILRLRLSSKEPEIEDVCVRVYACQEARGYDRPYAWMRASDRHKRRLCRASVCEPELLSDYERHNLLRWRWSPLAPTGMEGQDYRRRVLYSLDGIVDDEVSDREVALGLVVRPGLHAVIPLPSAPGTAHLECEATNSMPAKPVDLRVLWFGRNVRQRQT